MYPVLRLLAGQKERRVTERTDGQKERRTDEWIETLERRDGAVGGNLIYYICYSSKKRSAYKGNSVKKWDFLVPSAILNQNKVIYNN